MNIDQLPQEYIDRLRKELDPSTFKYEIMNKPKNEDLKYRYADGPNGAYITHVIYPNGDIVPYDKNEAYIKAKKYIADIPANYGDPSGLRYTHPVTGHKVLYEECFQFLLNHFATNDDNP
jgi:hypothetical protein